MKRRLRILVGGGLVGAGAWTVLPGMIHPISTDAVINAEVVTVRAPVDGVLQAAAMAVGGRVDAGQVVARVRNFRPDSGRRDGLALELAGQRRLEAALKAEIAELGALQRHLAGESEAFRAAAAARLRLSETEARARLAAAEAALARARAELERRRILAGKGLVAPAGLQAAEADARGATAGVDALRAELARIEAERRAAGAGTYVAGGVNNVPYSRQRLDEVRLKLAERRRELAGIEARVAELAAQSAAAEAELARLAEAAVVAPTAGVVWQRFAGDGDSVRGGDPVLGLVDCRGLTLTAVLPKRFFPELKAGDRAQARLPGEGVEVAAMVQSVRAAGAGQASASAAVVPVAVERRDVVVTLVPAGRGLSTRSDNLCRVGQRATVTFDMPALKPLLDAVADTATEAVRGVVGAAAAEETP